MQTIVRIMLVIAISMAMTSCSSYKYVGKLNWNFWGCEDEYDGFTVTRINDKGEPYYNPRLEKPGGLGKEEYYDSWEKACKTYDVIYLAPDEWKGRKQEIHLIRDGDAEHVYTLTIVIKTRRLNVAKAYCDEEDEDSYAEVYHKGKREDTLRGIPFHIRLCPEESQKEKNE